MSSHSHSSSPSLSVGQGHGQGHSHGAGAGGDDRRRLALVLAITTTILVVEVVGAVASGSLALLADAGHMLTDAAGLVIALIAATLALRPETDARTWGYRRAEVLAATLQAAVLLAVGVFVLIEGARRLVEPPQVSSGAMIVFGIVGLVGNLVSMLVLTRGGSGTFNMRAAVLEVANDALGSVAVLVAAAVIALTGWQRADAVVSIGIGLLILPRTLRLLRETAEVLLEATPRGLDLADVRAHMLALEHVRGVHDLHASQIATGLPVLTAHVVVDDSCCTDGHAPQMLDQLQTCVAGHFGISVHHSTFQLEPTSHADHEAGLHA
ncbi:MAG: cation diffusion facilitator family transporter [Mycobacteriales bacterium]